MVALFGSRIACFTMLGTTSPLLRTFTKPTFSYGSIHEPTIVMVVLSNKLSFAQASISKRYYSPGFRSLEYKSTSITD